MKVGRSTGPAAYGAPQRVAAPSGFAPADAATPAAGARVGATGALAGLDALLALQEQGGPLERRRRQVARAGRLLDKLDAVKLALLGGGAEGAALQGLARAAAESREGVDDPRLNEVLDAIETRAAVELAKRGQGAPR
ncbi:MAG: flagellar assembly protein FliX [Caulobacteraceae bacterium]|nr:flagellar assembly protein FliX [Caulobacter sp.]